MDGAVASGAGAGAGAGGAANAGVAVAGDWVTGLASVGKAAAVCEGSTGVVAAGSCEPQAAHILAPGVLTRVQMRHATPWGAAGAAAVWAPTVLQVEVCQRSGSVGTSGCMLTHTNATYIYLDPWCHNPP